MQQRCRVGQWPSHPDWWWGSVVDNKAIVCGWPCLALKDSDGGILKTAKGFFLDLEAVGTGYNQGLRL